MRLDSFLFCVLVQPPLQWILIILLLSFNASVTMEIIATIYISFNFVYNLRFYSCPYVGERLIQYASENLVTEILIHPQYNTLIQCMRNMLSSFTKHRHIIHSGYTFSGNGSWILQVRICFSIIINNFLHVSNRTIADWTNKMRKSIVCKYLILIFQSIVG